MGNKVILEMMLTRASGVCEEVKEEKWQLLSSGSASKVETAHAFDFCLNLINRAAYSVSQAIEVAKKFFVQAIFADVRRMLETALS